MDRPDNRQRNEIRKINITRGYTIHADGSVLMECGNTKVICTACVEDKVPPFLKGTGQGWVTCEYGMLPGSTITRKPRDISKLKLDGRTAEIQRLIGRAMRSVVDLSALGERTIWIDCDVIQADGGTRTASITGAFVALADAVNKLYREGKIESYPLRNYVAAISVGVRNGEVILDLNYEEDSSTQVDMNVVMTDKGEFVEIQGTGEESPFTRVQLNEMLQFAEEGVSKLIQIQKNALGDDDIYNVQKEIIAHEQI